jgi:hypothetical protein
MTIFMLQEEYVSGEDYYGRDLYEERLCEEEGYFTSREAAQEWIDKRIEKAQESHKEDVKLAERRIAEWQAEKNKYDADMAEVHRFSQEKGIKVEAWGFRKQKPGIPKFTPPTWNIVEIDEAT